MSTEPVDFVTTYQPLPRADVAQQLTNLIKQIEAIVVEHGIEFELPDMVCRSDYDGVAVWTKSIHCTDYASVFNEVRKADDSWQKHYYAAVK